MDLLPAEYFYLNTVLQKWRKKVQTCFYELTGVFFPFLKKLFVKMLNAPSLIKCRIVQASDCPGRSRVPMVIAMMPIDEFTVCKPSPQKELVQTILALWSLLTYRTNL